MTNHPAPSDAFGRGDISSAARQQVLADLANGRDATNPSFLYSTTAAPLLLAIAAGLIDPAALARRELASRGLDADGTWVGFGRAAQIHGVTR